MPSSKQKAHDSLIPEKARHEDSDLSSVIEGLASKKEGLSKPKGLPDDWMLGDASTIKDLELAINFVLDQMLTIEQLMVNIILHFEAVVKNDKAGERIEVAMLMDVVKKFKSRPTDEQVDLEIYKKYKDEFLEVMYRTRGSVLKTSDKLKEYLGGARHDMEQYRLVTSFRDILETIYNNEERLFTRESDSEIEYEFLRKSVIRNTQLKRRHYFDMQKDGDDFMRYPRISLDDLVGIR